MEVLKLDIVGSYSYKPDVVVASYGEKNVKYEKECIICKRDLIDPSYEILSDNKNMTCENKIMIGKCGHMFHNECLKNWLKNCECCPIDKVKWHLDHVADTTTKLILLDVKNKNVCK